MLSDAEIREAIKNGELKISSFDEGSLGPASYNLRIGGYFVENGKLASGERSLEKRGEITIPTLTRCLFETYEALKLSDKISCSLGPTAALNFQGLLVLPGSQVDPGFNGSLLVSALNVSPTDITLKYLEPVIHAKFFWLSKPATKPGRERPSGEIAAEIVAKLELEKKMEKHVEDIRKMTETLADELARFRQYST